MWHGVDRPPRRAPGRQVCPCHMEKAAVSRPKNNLSAGLRRVRAGQLVGVYQRDVPIARIDRIENDGRGADRLGLLAAQGLVQPASHLGFLGDSVAARRRDGARADVCASRGGFRDPCLLGHAGRDHFGPLTSCGARPSGCCAGLRCVRPTARSSPRRGWHPVMIRRRSRGCAGMSAWRAPRAPRISSSSATDRARSRLNPASVAGRSARTAPSDAATRNPSPCRCVRCAPSVRAAHTSRGRCRAPTQVPERRSR